VETKDGHNTEYLHDKGGGSNMPYRILSIPRKKAKAGKYLIN